MIIFFTLQHIRTPSHPFEVIVTNLVIVRKSIHFVDQDFKCNILVDAIGARHGVKEPMQRFRVIILRLLSLVSSCHPSNLLQPPLSYLGINDKDQRTDRAKDFL